MRGFSLFARKQKNAEACPLVGEAVLVMDVNGTLVGPTEEVMARHGQGLDLDGEQFCQLHAHASEIAKQTGHARSVGFWLAILEAARAQGMPLTEERIACVAKQTRGAEYPDASAIVGRLQREVLERHGAAVQLAFVPITGGFGAWRLNLPVVAGQQPEAAVAATFSKAMKGREMIVTGADHFLYGNGKVDGLEAIVRGKHHAASLGDEDKWEIEGTPPEYFPVTPGAIVFVGNLGGDHDARAFEWMHRHGGRCVLVREPGTSDKEWRAQQRQLRKCVDGAVEADYQTNGMAHRTLAAACHHAAQAACEHAQRRWELIQQGDVRPMPHELNQMAWADCSFGEDIPAAQRHGLGFACER